MGMYTELIFGAALKSDTPDMVIKTLRYLIGECDIDCELDFKTKSGRTFYSGSYYFGITEPVNKLKYDEIREGYYLSIRCSLKNYENEIEDFLKWIKPYIYIGSGANDMYAIVMYEESEVPRIYYLDND